MATCAEVVDYELPANAAEDSVSLLTTLRGKGTPEPLHHIVVHHSASGHFAVRKGEWKLLLCRGSGGWSPPRESAAAQQGLPLMQLYDLADDPKETRNLYERHTEKVTELIDDLALHIPGWPDYSRPTAIQRWLAQHHRRTAAGAIPPTRRSTETMRLAVVTTTARSTSL